MASLLNKVVLITGASTGIGAHTAKYLAAYKPKLVLVARSAGRLKTVEAQCLAAGCGQDDVLTVTGDMGRLEELAPLVDTAVSRFGQLDVLVNNAATFVYSDVEHSHPDDFDRCMAVNIRAPLFLAQAAMPHLKKTQGCIINLSSIAAQYSSSDMAPYSISKTAIEHFTRLLAFAGVTKTDTFQKIFGKLRDPSRKTENKPAKPALTEVQPLGGMCDIEDVSKVVTFLASDQSSALTGCILQVTRGGHLHRFGVDFPEEYKNIGDVNISPAEERMEQLAQDLTSMNYFGLTP